MELNGLVTWNYEERAGHTTRQGGVPSRVKYIQTPVTQIVHLGSRDDCFRDQKYFFPRQLGRKVYQKK